MNSIGQEIYKSIQEQKWLSIKYKNKNEEITYFWFDVVKIDNENHRLIGYIYNLDKDRNVKENISLFFKNILECEVIEFSNGSDKTELLKDIESNLEKYKWLSFVCFNNNVLLYLKEARRLDCNPKQEETYLIPGIDLKALENNKKIKLNEEQEGILIKQIFKNQLEDKKLKYNELVISTLAIESNSNEKYILAYHHLIFNPIDKYLSISKDFYFNKNVMDNNWENQLFSLFSVDEINWDDFITEYKNDTISASIRFADKLNDKYGNKYKISTRPYIMILERPYQVQLEQTFNSIEDDYENKRLSPPIKAFFGGMSNRYGRKIEPSIVIYDERIDLSQMRVLYNTMKQPVTYVQGPPGTGKTQTILNVILSQYINSRTTLICSSNNKPVDGIIEKISNTFFYRDKHIEMPYLRLGNKERNLEACNRIWNLYNLEINDSYKSDDNKLASIKLRNDERNKKLVTLLDNYEERKVLEEKIESLNKFIETCKKEEDSSFLKALGRLKEKLSIDLNNIPEATQEQALGLFVPAKQSNEILQFLFFDSIKRIRLLKQPKFKDLIEIVNLKDKYNRAKSFKGWLNNDENLKNLLNVFPIIFATNISSSFLGSGHPMFDLTIMDEAGQCNPCDALLPIARGRNLLLVGDPQQLRPVFMLNSCTNQLLMEKYKIDESYCYVTHSILSMMLAHDKISKFIFLNHHYRCGKKIIEFSNKVYYDSKLHLEKIKEDGNLVFINSKNSLPTIKNTSIEESVAIVDYIYKYGYENVNIVTPFNNQVDLINEMLEKKGLNNVKATTIHKIQGSENDAIIMSLALSPKTKKETWNWIRNNQELINVAVTRAKNNFVLLADTEVVQKLGTSNDDLVKLVKYVESNGKKEILEAITPKKKDYSNNSENEREFYETISHFCTCYEKYSCKRNVDLKNLFPSDPYLKDSKQNLDLVLYTYDKKNRLQPSIVFEIDGGEHFINSYQEQLDRKKNQILQERGVKEIIISNSLVKDYETICSLIFAYKDKESFVKEICNENTSHEENVSNVSNNFSNNDTKPRKSSIFVRLLGLFKKK